MKTLLLTIIAFITLFSNITHADTLFGGAPRMTIEYEHEVNTAKYGSTVNDAISLFPGIAWSGTNRPLGFVNKAEIMMEGNQDNVKLGSSTGNSTEVKFGARITNAGKFNETWGYYIRGLVGQAINSDMNYTFWYIEPAIKTKFNDHWSWTTAYRAVRTFDNVASSKEVDKFRFGPNYNLDRNNNFELRYVISTDVHANNEIKSNATIFEYTHYF